MLMVTRRVGERIVVGGAVEIHVAKIGRTTVRLGVRAPPGFTVLRGEVWDAVAARNREATGESVDEASVDEAIAGATAPRRPPGSPDDPGGGAAPSGSPGEGTP